MGILAKQGTFLAALVAVVGLSVGSLAFSQAVTFGAETDTGAETDVSSGSGETPIATNDQFPQLGGPPIVTLPPAAPIDPGTGGTGGTGTGGPSGGVGGNANALPSAGSGGYLDAGSNGSLSYALVALAVAVALTGSLSWVHSRK